MRLEPGHEAPDFEATLWDGGRVRLADRKGKKTWLAFFRYAGCPLCNLRVHRTLGRYATLAASGVELLAVFQSTPETIREYVAEQKPPFPLISDPDEGLYRLYGVETSLAGFLAPTNMLMLAVAMKAGFGPGRMDGSKTRIPADFLIGPDLRVDTAFYGKTIGDHIPFEAVDAFAAGPSHGRV